MRLQLEFWMDQVVSLQENLSIAIIRCDLAIVTHGKSLGVMVVMDDFSSSVFSCIHFNHRGGG